MISAAPSPSTGIDDLEVTPADDPARVVFFELVRAIENHPEIDWILKSWATSPRAAATIRLQNALAAGKAALHNPSNAAD